jgi:hypothetical protein
MIFRLHVLNGPLRGQQVMVPPESLLAGRGPDCALVIPDPELALHHAVFEHRPAGLFVRDLGAMGRVLVNRREQREAKLKHGDIVELAHTRLLVQVVVQTDSPAPVQLKREKRIARWLALLTVLIVVMLAGLLLAPYLKRASRSAVAPPPRVITNISPPVVMVVTTAPPADELRRMREEIEIVREALRLAAARTAAPPVVITVTSPPPRVVTPPPPPVMPVRAKVADAPQVKIVTTEQQRLPEQPQFDELRILHIALQPVGAAAPPAGSVSVKTDFFDEDQYTGRIAPTEALTPRAELRPDTWQGAAPVTLTASYAVPAGLRDRQLRDGRRIRYAGYRVRVYVAGALHAEAVHPAWLLEGRP